MSDLPKKLSCVIFRPEKATDPPAHAVISPAIIAYVLFDHRRELEPTFAAELVRRWNTFEGLLEAAQCGLVVISKLPEKLLFECTQIHSDEKYKPFVAEAHSTKIAAELVRRWNTFEGLLEAAQGGLVLINELLIHVQPVLKMAGLKPVPEPPTNGIREAIIKAGGKVYENAEQAKQSIAEAEKNV